MDKGLLNQQYIRSRPAQLESVEVDPKEKAYEKATETQTVDELNYDRTTTTTKKEKKKRRERRRKTFIEL